MDKDLLRKKCIEKGIENLGLSDFEYIIAEDYEEFISSFNDYHNYTYTIVCNVTPSYNRLYQLRYSVKHDRYYFNYVNLPNSIIEVKING